MNEIGHNSPPSQIDFSKETVEALSAWMKDNPVIQTEEVAREAKLLVDRGVLCSKDLTDERQSQTGPLLKQVEDIRDKYRAPQTILDRVVMELQARLQAFLFKLEEQRKTAAEEAKRIAEEAERTARLAEEAEQRAKNEAKQGVCDVDVGQATAAADEAFSRFKHAKKEAKRAERDTAVKIGGGFRRAASLRTSETLTIDNVHEAIDALGLTDAIRDTILSEARAYRKAFGELPDGVSSKKERS